MTFVVFVSHTRSDLTRDIESTPVVIVDGILVLVDPQIRCELEIKLYVDTDPDIRSLRRIRRDLEQRGRSFESVREQYRLKPRTCSHIVSRSCERH